MNKVGVNKELIAHYGLLLLDYFNFSNNLGTLNMIFASDEQQNKYHQVWKEIFKIVNKGYGELKLHENIRLFYKDLPIKHVFKIHSIIHLLSH